MTPFSLIESHLFDVCPDVHSNHLQAIFECCYSPTKKPKPILNRIGRNIAGDIEVKHKIKKVDRLKSNHHLCKPS